MAFRATVSRHRSLTLPACPDARASPTRAAVLGPPIPLQLHRWGARGPHWKENRRDARQEPAAGAQWREVGAPGRVRAMAKRNRVHLAAVRGPVQALAFGYGGETRYVLNGTAASMAVTRISSSSFHVAGAVRVPRDPIGIVPDRSETGVWTLQRSGALEETSLASGETLAAFPTGNPDVAVAASPGGDRIHVLKRTATTMNVSIITSETEDVERVVPASLDSVSLALSPDCRTLHDFIWTPRHGNIQEITLVGGGG